MAQKHTALSNAIRPVLYVLGWSIAILGGQTPAAIAAPSLGTFIKVHTLFSALESLEKATVLISQRWGHDSSQSSTLALKPDSALFTPSPLDQIPPYTVGFETAENASPFMTFVPESLSGVGDRDYSFYWSLTGSPHPNPLILSAWYLDEGYHLNKLRFGYQQFDFQSINASTFQTFTEYRRVEEDETNTSDDDY